MIDKLIRNFWDCGEFFDKDKLIWELIICNALFLWVNYIKFIFLMQLTKSDFVKNKIGESGKNERCAKNKSQLLPLFIIPWFEHFVAVTC